MGVAGSLARAGAGRTYIWFHFLCDRGCPPRRAINGRIDRGRPPYHLQRCRPHPASRAVSPVSPVSRGRLGGGLREDTDVHTILYPGAACAVLVHVHVLVLVLVLCCAPASVAGWLAARAPNCPPPPPKGLSVIRITQQSMVPRNEDQARRPPPNPRFVSVQSITSKYSFRSHSSAFEADDERSTTTDSGSMSPRDSLEDGATPRRDRYPGEDTRPTSSKELAGWYMYAFAAETYMICGTSPHLFGAPSKFPFGGRESLTMILHSYM